MAIFVRKNEKKAKKCTFFDFLEKKVEKVLVIKK